MKIAQLDSFVVSVPYRWRENSARVRRDGVSAVLVRLETEEGLIGWGECCPGPDVECIGTIKALLGFRVKRFGRVLVPFSAGCAL